MYDPVFALVAKANHLVPWLQNEGLELALRVGRAQHIHLALVFGPVSVVFST
jgi:hypothetical protein